MLVLNSDDLDWAGSLTIRNEIEQVGKLLTTYCTVNIFEPCQ